MINICAMFSNSPNLLVTEEKKPEKPKESLKTFRLPIHCLEDLDISASVHPLSDIIARDLELVETTPLNDKETERKSMYEHVFQPITLFAKDLLPDWKTHFTTDISFLEQTQDVVKTISNIMDTDSQKKYEVPCERIKEIWTAIKHDDNFMDKYGYIEWSFLDQFNHSQGFLQAMSICNIISPLLSFIIPFIFLLFPFILLKIQGVPITLSIYFQCLTDIAKHHFIGKALKVFQSFSIESFFYLVGSLGLYLLQMYNNTVQCLRFYKNIQFVNDSLCELKEYIDDSIMKKKKFLQYNREKSQYRGFCKEVLHHCQVLERIQLELQSICPFQVSLYKVADIGYMMKCFYALHTNPDYERTILYSMGFEGYLQNMHGLCQQVAKGVLNPATFYNEKDTLEKDDDSIVSEDTEKEDDDDLDIIDNNDKIEPKKYIKGQFYPAHQYDNYVVNNANLDNKIIITGPNASGKTTFLKTTALNLLFSQQFGFGFYQCCCIEPYTHFHSYLNIPDTSGRDSLFQAESRRCKEILDIIQEKKNMDAHHFCIFDELYSGTNPVEATKSAYAFMQYLTKQFPKVDFLLTTHYVQICDKIKGICNYQMEVLEKDNDFEFTYKIEPGISRIEGAIKILRDMNYPSDIIDMIQNTSFIQTKNMLNTID
jgi:hypothetical protein